MREYLHGHVKEAYVDPSSIRRDDVPRLAKGKVCGSLREFAKFASGRIMQVELISSAMMSSSETSTATEMLSSRASSPFGNRQHGIARSPPDWRRIVASARSVSVATCSRTGCNLARLSCDCMRKCGCPKLIYLMLITTRPSQCRGRSRMQSGKRSLLSISSLGVQRTSA